jgi:predicted DNA-binding transcriptional regulator AlpA
MSIAEGTTMNHPDKSASQKSEPQQPEVQSQLPKNSGAFVNNPRFMACLVFLPEDSKPLADLLQELQEFAITSHPVRNFGEPAESKQPAQPSSADSWLTHVEAALYLGISKTTLYRYACQQVVESRKMGGRLQYRQSALDRFQDQQTRPARFPSHAESIITPALRSGK